jgi:hypothetical protein
MNLEAKNKSLKRCYEFTDEDLKANRNGVLSESQLKSLEELKEFKLERAKVHSANLMTVAVVLLGAFFCLILPSLLLGLLIFGASVLSTFGEPSVLFGMIAMLVVGTGFIYASRRLRDYLTKRATRKYVFRQVEGPVQLEELEMSGRYKNYKQYQMKIGDAVFVLEDELVPHIKKGDNCVVYFLDYQDGSEGAIMSMECTA